MSTTMGIALICIAAWVAMTVALVIREERRQARQDQAMAHLQMEVQQAKAILDHLHTVLTDQHPAGSARPQLALAPPQDQTAQDGTHPHPPGNTRRRVLLVAGLLVAVLLVLAVTSLIGHLGGDSQPEQLVDDVQESFAAGLD